MQRGKSVAQTPIGRALFAFFIRTDMQSSVVTGNPMFLDESWWTNDPLYNVPISSDSPLLLAADAALTKLCVIVAKITLLKRSAAIRRKKLLSKMHQQSSAGGNLSVSYTNLENQIRKQVNNLRRELEAWHRGLPSWFSSLNSDQMADGEEDINSTDIVEIRPQRYPHHSIPLVLTGAFAANIQLWRVACPDEVNPPPRIGALVHALFRAFLAIPQSADCFTTSNVWIAALLLRNRHHRDWLEAQIRRRIQENDFFGWKFAYHGILHGWAALDGTEEGRFKSVPEGAQEIVPGVSENLWRADGVMNTKLAHLSVEDESPGERPIYRFVGDTEIFPMKEPDDDEPKDGPNEDGMENKRIPLYESFVDDF